jgi:poly-gamma-glutamate system protein
MRTQLLGVGEHTNLKVLINTGGAMANIGTSESILRLKPGLVSSVKIPSEDKQGLIHRVAQHKIPIIHLLFIKGLAIEYGIQWDPATSINAE